MDDKQKVLNAALAGLLHDVGKFAHRAGVVLAQGVGDGWNENSRREYGYRHAYTSAGFIQKYVPSGWIENLHGAAYHHQPADQQDHWIQLADRLSSSERESEEDNLIPRLQSIFSSLRGYHQAYYLPLKKLNPLERACIFPVPLKENAWGDQCQKEYQQLWQQFERECQARQINTMQDLLVYLENVSTVLQDFTTCIPSGACQGIPDVSLYDHCRTTAAIAACLAADNRSIDWCKQAATSGNAICYLVGADLSGLQKFIYTLASSGAAKSLRARSFYVQMVSEVIADYVLEALKLPITNMLYVGGGGFQLLVPISAENTLCSLKQDIADRLLALHGGALGLSLCWTELTYADFEHFNQAYDRLGKDLNGAKRQPFGAASPEKLLAAIGQPITAGGDPIKFCQVTGEDGPTVKLEDGEYKSLFVLSLENLGRLLPKAKYILLNRCDPIAPSIATNWQSALKTFGMHVQLTDSSTISPEQASSGQMVRIWRLNPVPDGGEAQLLEKFAPASRVVSYRPFARLTPTDRHGAPKTFDELAIPRKGNFQRWGVLRMDVDNLGKLFQEGFGEQASLARIASLSYALRIFFEGWLPKISQPHAEIERAKDDLSAFIYIQYSGGDDLFVVGAWDALPEFARRVRQSFGQYVCGNPHVTLSGGMVMVDKGFPLYQAAEQAGEAEGAAKVYQRPMGGDKDAFTFLDTPMDWQTFSAIQVQAETLASGVERRLLPHALLQILLALHAQIQEARRKGKKFRFGPWTWMAAYQLTRMASQAKDEERQRIVELRDKFLKPDEQTDALGLAARWAQYLTKGG